MRVIGGRFGGRKLVTFKSDHIRPTSDRVKESLFNKFAPYWPESRVLDLFSGTGNLTIEAVSWGASYVESVEKHPKSISIMRENFELLGIKNEVKTVRSDVLEYLTRYSGSPFDVILIDPPFTEKMAHEVMEKLSTSRVWASATVIAVEYSKFERMDKEYGKLKCFDTKNFGDKLMSFFQEGASGD